MKKGYTQEDLAEKLNISRFTIMRYENGERVPDMILAEKIRRLLNIPYKTFYEI